MHTVAGGFAGDCWEVELSSLWAVFSHHTQVCPVCHQAKLLLFFGQWFLSVSEHKSRAEAATVELRGPPGNKLRTLRELRQASPV